MSTVENCERFVVNPWEQQVVPGTIKNVTVLHRLQNPDEKAQEQARNQVRFHNGHHGGYYKHPPSITKKCVVGKDYFFDANTLHVFSCAAFYQICYFYPVTTKQASTPGMFGRV